MARSLRKIALVAEAFALRSPAQQLLDRFLAGYPRAGAFHRCEGCQVSVHLASGETDPPELDRRVRDFGLVREGSLEEALTGADAVVIVWRGHGAEAKEELLRAVLQRAPTGAPVFVYGVLAPSITAAKAFNQLAASRNLPLLTGTATGSTYRLPNVDVPPGARLKEALIVVQGAFPDAELEALDGLLPILERRHGGETGVSHIRFVEGDEVWRAGDQGRWSRRLLAAAISRSDSPQGDPVKDGRTQDLVALGLVPGLARHPRGWLIGHRDGLRSTILVLDGVVADYNFAVATADGDVISAQLYRPPEPAQAHFNLLAGTVEDFFRSSRPPWPVDRSLLVAGLMEAFKQPAARDGHARAMPA